MFYDETKVFLKAGDGGDGCMSFLRQKYMPKGGPNGGNGARVEMLFCMQMKISRICVLFILKNIGKQRMENWSWQRPKWKRWRSMCIKTSFRN